MAGFCQRSWLQLDYRSRLKMITVHSETKINVIRDVGDAEWTELTRCASEREWADAVNRLLQRATLEGRLTKTDKKK